MGPREALATQVVPVAEVNWLGDGGLTDMAEREIAVRIRSTRPPRAAILRATGPRTAEIELLDPEEGVSPGQACVFYEAGSTRVLGGGWITKRETRR